MDRVLVQCWLPSAVVRISGSFRRRRRWLRTLADGILALLVSLLLIANGFSTTPRLVSSDGAVVRAASGGLPVAGGTATLPIVVTNVQNLGATTVVVGYDRTQVEPVQCQRGPAFSTGLCNRQFDQDGDGAADAVRFNVITLDGVDVAAGETAVLVEITWQPIDTPTVGTTTPLTVTVLSFDDTEGLPVDVSGQDGEIVFEVALTATATPTPTGTPTDTPAPTSTATPTRTPAATGTPTPTQVPSPTAPGNQADTAVYLPSIFAK